MAQLDETARLQVWRGYQRSLSVIFEVIGLDKTELKAAVDATDVWIDDNQAAYNAALPAAAQTNLTLQQKTLLFCAVALRRVSLNLLKKVFGEVE